MSECKCVKTRTYLCNLCGGTENDDWLKMYEAQLGMNQSWKVLAEHNIEMAKHWKKKYFDAEVYLSGRELWKQRAVSAEKEVDELRTKLKWIKKAHHLDGCDRRTQPYPLNNQEEKCSCGRKEILKEIGE